MGRAEARAGTLPALADRGGLEQLVPARVLEDHPLEPFRVAIALPDALPVERRPRAAEEPNRAPLRAFTSQKTSVSPRATTRSSSPIRHRQLRATGRYPRRRYRANAASSPALPILPVLPASDRGAAAQGRGRQGPRRREDAGRGCRRDGLTKAGDGAGNARGLLAGLPRRLEFAGRRSRSGQYDAGSDEVGLRARFPNDGHNDVRPVSNQRVNTPADQAPRVLAELRPDPVVPGETGGRSGYPEM